MDIETRFSDESARSVTKRSLSKSIFAPDVTAMSVFPFTPVFATYWIRPAILSAPAGSRTVLVSLKPVLIAAQISSVEHVIVPSQSSLISPNVFFSHCSHGRAIGKEANMWKGDNFSFLEGGCHTCSIHSLNSNHLNMRHHLLYISRHARKQATATHTTKYGIKFLLVFMRNLFHNFHTNRTLSTDNQWVIKRVDQRSTALRESHRFCLCLVIGHPMEQHISAPLSNCVDFDCWSSLRHYDNCIHTQHLCAQCHTLCMISRRTSHNTLG
mmetsp:Transcript_10148/g.22088  ORF Transcript_10148/g.22088 Transcript_10148/m.22088 type:complete len:269 (+) Transcript_10148:5492-6298(+)